MLAAGTRFMITNGNFLLTPLTCEDIDLGIFLFGTPNPANEAPKGPKDEEG